jgi:hypothetical protein
LQPEKDHGWINGIIMPNAKVDFLKEDIRLRVDNATQESLIAIALRIEERAKIKIVQNDQVDTGAMLNGIYAAWPGSSNYGAAASAASARSKGGTVVNEAPQAATEGPSALVAGAMDYTIWQEYLRPFLYPAFVETAREAGGIIEATAKGFF